MLEIFIRGGEFFDPGSGTFLQVKDQALKLEHSLVSLSKWESKWHKAFLGREPKTQEESIDYIRCMTLTQNVNPDVYKAITPQTEREVFAYINAPMTATTFPPDDKNRPNRKIVTAEIIYYWMICENIPFECQKWHLNRLMTLINVCRAENAPRKKMSKKEIMARNRALNASRRRKTHSRG